MTGSAREKVILEELFLADQAFRAAEALRGLGLVLDALSRLYFAGFHLARALLASQGLEVKTHRGVHGILGMEFVKTGKLEQIHQQTLARLETWRGRADYERGFAADEVLFDAEIEAARRLRERILDLLREAGFRVDPEAR